MTKRPLGRARDRCRTALGIALGSQRNQQVNPLALHWPFALTSALWLILALNECTGRRRSRSRSSVRPGREQTDSRVGRSLTALPARVRMAQRGQFRSPKFGDVLRLVLH